MTKRFQTNHYKIYDKNTGNEYLLTESDDITELLNNLNLKSSERSKALSKLQKENDKLKSELSIYRDIAYCGNCKYHDYDWYVDDGYGGDEFEVCNKGNDVTEGICREWAEL